VQKAAFDVLQMLKVQRAFLRGRELLRFDRVHRPADDARLDHRARIHADNRFGVVHRIEVVVAR
jgi:hypothetical protein